MRFIIGAVGSRLRRVLPIGVGISAVIMTACKLPEAPQWDVGVTVPLASDPILIDSLLPDEVTIDSVGGVPVFALEDQADSADYLLGSMCPACGALQGLTTQVPSFDYQDSIDVAFDPDLRSVEMQSAELVLFIVNNLNFDPLRPGAGGYMALAVRDLSSGALLDSIFVDGATQSMPPGQRTEFNLVVSVATITQGFRVLVNVHSPSDGQTVTIDNNLGARFGAILENTQIAAITAVVAAETLDQSFIMEFDQDLRDDLSDNFVAATYTFEMSHNIDITGSLEASIAGSPLDLFSGDPAREIRLIDLTFEPDEEQTGVLSAQDIDQIAAFPEVYLGYRGSVSGAGPGNTSRFTPGQSFQTKLTFTTVVRVEF